MKIGESVVDSVFQIVAALGLSAGVAAGVLIWRARKPIKVPSPCCTAPEEAPPAPRSGLRAWLARLGAALDYLRTRREWRYRTPWVLLAGEAGSGKTSLIASAAHRQDAPPHSDELEVEGIAWQFFDLGALLDPDGRLAAAAPGSAEAKEWARVLREIEALRPERALDGVLMTVSARSLLHATPEQRRALADDAWRQLGDIQQRFGFVLPVYVAVTACDTIDGFAAFWRALPAARRREMFGWSAPGQLAQADPGLWAGQAFDSLSERLTALQLDAAGDIEQIADGDGFVLFPRHFQALRAPLEQWLATVFQPSAWHAGFLFRGVYFTGSLAADGARIEGPRLDVAFVDDLIAHKVLAERNLAQPTRSSVWSRSLVIRRLQIAGVAAFCALLVALGFAAFQLKRQVDALVASLDMLDTIPAVASSGAHCAGAEQVYPLLAQLARINAHAVYWAIPASWFDARASRHSAQAIADSALERAVLPSLSCRLEARARELAGFQPRTQTGADAYVRARQDLFGFLQQVRDLEQNLDRFGLLATPAPQSRGADLMPVLAQLAEYAYGSPLPATVAHQRGALSAALAHVEYEQPLLLPEQMRQRFLNLAAPMARTLREALGQEVGAGGTLLARLNRGEEPILPATLHFTRWLSWVRESWLGSSAQSNPCEDIRSELDALTRPLLQRHGYPEALAALIPQFNAAQCYAPSMRTLNGMHLPPYGPLFAVSNGALDLNPKLQPELDGLLALSGLGFMQVTDTRDFACLPGGAGWNPADVGEAGNFLRAYEEFARQQGLPPLGADPTQRPLYDRLARHQLERAVNSVLRAAQAPDARALLIETGIQAASQADQQLARDSARFGEASAPLLNVLRMLGQTGFDASRTRITQCVRDYAADQLGRTDALAGISRLYDPGAGGDGFFRVGTTPVTLDYLARQVARSQVLAGYAAPFVSFLHNTDPINEVQLANAQTAPYWNNTITELNRYVQFKEPAGQVANLHDLFLKQFAAMDAATCAKALADYQAPPYGNDLFSQRRQALEEQAGWRCSDKHRAQALEAWRALSTRFNRDLANRYPFAAPGARDADPAVVKAFFADYAQQSAALRQALPGLPADGRNQARAFLDRLDAVAAFFGPNLNAGARSQPIRLDIEFRARASASPGSNQIVSWTLAAGAQSAGWPNRSSTLEWQFGQPLTLDLAWADRSLWRPAADPRQPDLQIKGADAAFTAAGPWALLRLIEAHRPQSGAPADALDPERVLLEFTVPLVAADLPPGTAVTDRATLYLALRLAGTDPKTQAPAPLTLPDLFPRFAPHIKE